MVDTTDLKSVDSNGREGSSPSTPTRIRTEIIDYVRQNGKSYAIQVA